MIPTKLNEKFIDLAECLLKILADECCCDCGSSPLQPPHNTQYAVADTPKITKVYIAVYQNVSL